MALGVSTSHPEAPSRGHERAIRSVERNPIKRVHGPSVAGRKIDACFVNAQHELWPSRSRALASSMQ
jgi:hypothetical protein